VRGVPTRDYFGRCAMKSAPNRQKLTAQLSYDPGLLGNIYVNNQIKMNSHKVDMVVPCYSRTHYLNVVTNSLCSLI
jgi:hypothetical protein